MSHVELKTQIDRLFDGIEQVLARTKRLRAFTSFDMPRSLDLMILLQRNCPHIESIKITPSPRDGHGFVVFNPGQFPQLIMGRRPVTDGCVFPLWNIVNMNLDPGIMPVFDLPNLTVLSLCNIRYPWPGHHHIRSLVSILSGAPNLKCLELSGYPNSSIVVYLYPPPPPPPAPHPPPSAAQPPHPFPPPPPGWVAGQLLPPGWHPPRQFHLFSSLCKAYEKAGGKPLKLRYLRLFRGAELVNDWDPDPQRGHYLGAFTEFRYLEELHLDHPDYHMVASTTTGPGPRSRYLWPESIRLITEGFFPRLRRLSLPHTGGLVWPWLSKLDLDFAAKLSVQVYFPEYARWSQGYKEYLNHWDCLGNFRGLILTGWHTMGGLTANLPPNLSRTRSLSVFMPPHQWFPMNKKLPAWQKVLDDYVETFPQAPEMREVWLARAPVPFFRPSEHAPRGYAMSLTLPERLEYLARSLAEKYDNLSYIRIYESAWRIYRPSSAEDTDPGSRKNADKPAMELLPVSKKDIGVELPEAFDFSTPRVV